MKDALTFLQENSTFYLATVEGDQPRVRPFGAVAEYNGNFYIATNNTKKVYAQMIANPKIELSTFSKDGKWIRLSGEAVLDDSIEAKEAMLAANPGIQRMYTADSPIFAVFYIKDLNFTIESF